MNRFFLLCIPQILFWSGVIGQSTEFKIPLHTYKFSQEIAQAQAGDSIRIPTAAQYYSYIGEYQKALSVPNEIDLEWGFDTLTEADIKHFMAFEAQDAVDAIIKQATNEQIIIINEAHHKPRHRIFVRKLLKGLYANGYRYFGLEALSNCEQVPPPYCDTALMQRGYILNSPLSGTYVTEPQMGNLIEEAVSIGFELFAYEYFGQGRDSLQAQNISNILKQDPDAKILILCGWYHLLEEESQGRKWMANYLREMTSINPFTIYQDILIERNCSPESPFFTSMQYDKETVFINLQGAFYNGKPDLQLFDALVYHPRTRYIMNRPDWLVNYDNNKIYTPQDIAVPFPCLIKAFPSTRDNNSTPIDIIEKEYPNDPTALVLPPGHYRLEYLSITGEKQVQEVFVK